MPASLAGPHAVHVEQPFTLKSLPVIAFIALGFAWGISYGLTNVAVREIRPFPLVAVRTLFGVLFLALFALRRRPAWPKLWLDWLALGVPGILGTAIPLVLIAWGQQYVDSSLAAILVTSTPIFTLVLGHLVLHDERITLLRLAGVLVGFAGVIVLMSRNMRGVPQATLLATASLLLVAFCYAASSVFVRRFTSHHPSVLQSLVGQATALAVLGAITPFTAGGLAAPAHARTWVALLALGVVSTGIGYLLFFYLIGAIGPTRTQMINHMILVNGVLIGVLILGEALVWEMVVGGALILAGLVVVNWPQKSRRALPERPAPAQAGGGRAA